MTESQSLVLCVRNLSKSFDGITVLDKVNLEIGPGEVHGLIGENGSGKSTFVKLLGGVYNPDEASEFELWGQPVTFPVSQPQLHGLAFIHQDLALHDGMSVAENVGITSGFEAPTLGIYSRRKACAAVTRLTSRYGLKLDPNQLVGALSPSQRAVVGILRALRSLESHSGRQVLVLDEPTAALSKAESDRLLDIIRGLADSGTSVLFISHRLKEIRDTCDRVSVLRSGKLVRTVDAGETSERQLIELMLGYDLGVFYPERHTAASQRDVLCVQGLTGGSVDGISFTAGQGEIVGVTGLVGMGQDEVPYLLNGHARSVSGQVAVDDREVPNSVRGSLRSGIAVVPGNRLRDSIWANGTAVENMTLPFVARYSRFALKHRAEREFVSQEMERFGVRPLTPGRIMARFSGGNQQKIVLARWLQMRPRVLVLHEPTQGVDAGAKKEIFELIRQVADSGSAVVMVSSDMEEVSNVCHRVIIMRHGRVSEHLSNGQLSEDAIFAACQGAGHLAEGSDGA